MTKSYLDQIIEKEPHLVHKLKAKDSTGRWAYYFVHVQAHREQAFLKALKSEETINLEDYGKVVACNYGDGPSTAVIDQLKSKYGWEL